METITINVFLAAGDAVRVGSTKHGNGTVNLTSDIIASAGADNVALYVESSPRIIVTDLAPASVAAAIRAWADDKRAAQAKANADDAEKRAAACKRIDAMLDDVTAWRTSERTSNLYVTRYNGDKRTSYVVAKWTEVEPRFDYFDKIAAKGYRDDEVKQSEQVARERNTANEAAARAAAQVEANAINAQNAAGVEAWTDHEDAALCAFLDGDALERYLAGALPESECDELLTSDAFAWATGKFSEYQKIKASDVCGCDDESVSFDMDASTAWTAKAWNIRKAILEARPDALVTVRDHKGECSNCDKTCERESILVRLRDRTGVIRSRAFAV